MRRLLAIPVLLITLLAVMGLAVPAIAAASTEPMPVTWVAGATLWEENAGGVLGGATLSGDSWAFARAYTDDAEISYTNSVVELCPQPGSPWVRVAYLREEGWKLDARMQFVDMAGGTIVWSEKRQTDWDIYGYDVASQRTFPVCTGPGNQQRPRVSGDLVVWADDRGATSGWDIYGFDLNTLAEFPICTRVSTQWAPDVRGTTVVWLDTRNGNQDIYGATVDLATHTVSEFAVCTNASPQGAPDIGRSHVVWADARDSETHIYAKRLAGGAEQRLSDLPGDKSDYVVSDRTVIWWQTLEYGGAEYRIDGYNLMTDELFTTDLSWYTPDYVMLYGVDGPRFACGYSYRGGHASLLEFGWQSSVTIAAGAAWVTSPVLPLTLKATTAWNAITSVRYSEDGTHWGAWRHYGESASYTLSSGEGQRTLYAQFRGDDSRVSPVVSDGVGLDTVTPLTRDDAGDAWHASDVTVHFQSVDATSGVAGTEYRIDGGSWADATEVTVPAPTNHSFDGAHRIDYRSTDVAGNAESVRTCTVRIDTTPPTTSDSADGAWHNVASALVLTPSDAHAGVQKTEYRVDDGAWQSGATVSISSDGAHTVTYRSTDNAGNVEADKTATVKVDATAPVTTQTGADDAWHQSPVTVSFAASDATSGVEKTEYRLDAESWTTGTQLTVSTDGDHTLRYRSQDRAGSLEEAKTCRVRIDRTPPVTTPTGADGRWHNLAVTVAFAASDRASGVASTTWSTDGGATWETSACIVDAPATHDNDGTHVILYRSSDNAGLVEAPRSCTVKIDTRQPVTAAPSSTRVRRGYRATLRYRVDDQQPCASKANVTIKVTTLGGRVVKVLKLGQRAVNRTLSYQFRCTLAKRTYKFRVFAADAAGNKQAVARWNRLIVR